MFVFLLPVRDNSIRFPGKYLHIRVFPKKKIERAATLAAVVIEFARKKSSKASPPSRRREDHPPSLRASQIDDSGVRKAS